MARNMYGATSADFTLTAGGRVIPGAVLTLWSARTGGTQITDLLDVDSVATTTVTSDASGAVVYYGPNNDKTVHWADSGQGSRVAIRPVDITGDPPVMSIGTVGTGTAAASLTGTSEAPVLNLTLPSAGANGVDTAAIQSKAVTAAKIADDTITAAQIAANAIGSSELADNAVDTAAIQDGAVTSAKIADGTIVATDVAADQFAAFGTVGNLLTANQASGTDTLGDTTGFTVHNAATITSDPTPYSGTRSVKAVATGNAGMTFGLPGSTVTATVGQTYTAEVTTAATDAAASELILAFYNSGGTWIGQASKAYTGGGWRTVQITGVAPASTAAVSAYIYQATTTAGVSTVYADCWGIWKGAGGVWAMPGVPVTGQSAIAVNGAVDLSGTGSPEGVVTAAPGSTWLQTDATTDVKGWLRWVKASGTGNTGWVAGAEADTGRRDVSSLMSANATDTVGYVRMRRVGATVRLSMQMANSVTATAHELFAAGAIPTGFRPTNWIVPGVGTRDAMAATTLAGLSVAAGGSAHYSVPDGSYYYFEASWVTTDTWPSSLPGSAA